MIRRPSLAAAVLLLVPTLAVAEPPARTDAAGDPLPADAALRIGSGRFRFAIAGTVAVSPDASRLAVVSDNSDETQISLIDGITGLVTRRFSSPRLGGGWACFTGDGQKLLLFAFNKTMLLDLSNGIIDQSFTLGVGRGFQTLSRNRWSFSADGRLATSGNAFTPGRGTATIPVIELPTGKVVRSISPVQNFVVGSVLSPNGKTLATYGQFASTNPADDRERNRVVQIWDVATGNELFQLKSDIGSVTSAAAFSPDGKSLAAVTFGGTLYLWDAATGKEIRRCAGRDRCGRHLTFSADGKSIAAGGEDGVQVWDAATSRRLGTFQIPGGYVQGLISTANGRIRAWSQEGNVVHLTDVPSGKPLTPRGGHTGAILSVVFRDGGKTICSASVDGRICQWNAATGKETGPPLDLPSDDLDGGPRRGGHKRAITISPDGSHVAYCGMTRAGIRYFDLSAGRDECVFEGIQPDRHGVAFSDNGKYLAGAGSSRQQGYALCVWDVESGQRLPDSDLPGPQAGESSTVALSPDGKTVACDRHIVKPGVGNADETVLRSWDTVTGKAGLEIPVANGAIRWLSFLNDGRTLAVAGYQNQIDLWTLDGKRKRFSLNTTGVFTTPLVVSPDGRLLAAGLSDRDGKRGRVVVWELASGSIRHEFEGHSAPVQALAFSPDGNSLASGSDDTTILVWDLAGRRTGVAANNVPATAWADLSDGDAKKSVPIMRALLANPARTIVLFRSLMRPVSTAPVDQKELDRLIALLGDPSFAIRDKAARDLAAHGPTIRVPLQKALAGTTSAEFRRRAQMLLDQQFQSGPDLDLVRPVRALEVLERIGSPEAKAIVTAVASGRPPAPLTLEAKRTLARMK